MENSEYIPYFKRIDNRIQESRFNIDTCSPLDFASKYPRKIEPDKKQEKPSKKQKTKSNQKTLF